MARYIDADKAYEIARTEHKDFAQSIADLTSLREVLEDTPTADVVEVKHARWIEESSLYVHCSNCRTREYPREHNFKSKVCPECGAKMDSKKLKGE